MSQEQLEKELADRQVPLIIDFYATWCGPCVLLAKELEQVLVMLLSQSVVKAACLLTVAAKNFNRLRCMVVNVMLSYQQPRCDCIA